MMLAHYLNNLICDLYPELGFVQTVIEWGVLKGYVPIVMDREKDARAIAAKYDWLIEQYRIEVQAERALLWESYEPILDAIKQAGRMQSK